VDGERLALTGELTIRGHTERLEATGTIRYVAQDIAGRERVGPALEATVDRRRFGLDWNASLGRCGRREREIGRRPHVDGRGQCLHGTYGQRKQGRPTGSQPPRMKLDPGSEQRGAGGALSSPRWRTG
jgi:hypothetical protein